MPTASRQPAISYCACPRSRPGPARNAQVNAPITGTHAGARKWSWSTGLRRSTSSDDVDDGEHPQQQQRVVPPSSSIAVAPPRRRCPDDVHDEAEGDRVVKTIDTHGVRRAGWTLPRERGSTSWLARP